VGASVRLVALYADPEFAYAVVNLACVHTPIAENQATLRRSAQRETEILPLSSFCLGRANLRHKNVANIVPVRNEFQSSLCILFGRAQVWGIPMQV
jgi:hypothetical protein